MLCRRSVAARTHLRRLTPRCLLAVVSGGSFCSLLCPSVLRWAAMSFALLSLASEIVYSSLLVSGLLVRTDKGCVHERAHALRSLLWITFEVKFDG